MNTTDLDLLIAEGKKEFRDIVFNSEISMCYMYFTQREIRFIDCEFNAKLVLSGLSNLEVSIIFHNCKFNQVEVTSCILKGLRFGFIKQIQELNIFENSFDELHIDSNSQPIVTNIYIDRTLVKNFISCSRLNISKGQFTLSVEKNKISQNENFKCLFSGARLDIISFSGFFGLNSNFDNLIVKSSTFQDCNFDKVSFNKSNLGDNIFHDCKFHSKAEFANCEDLKTSNLKFKRCLFKGFTHFNESKFNCFDIQHTTFEKKTSFDRLETNTLKFYQVTFLQSTYFDELKINKLNDRKYIKNLSIADAKDLRRSLRLIKHELQKSENRIDYNRFRNYELKIHYQELKFKSNPVDTFILYTTKWSTNFGSWAWAFWFTILSGLFWYTILYFFEFYVALNLNNNESYAQGVFRFFMVTDFSSPFLQKEYLNNGFSWTIFVLGKIFIAFGIYEMIQAFRKFKA